MTWLSGPLQPEKLLFGVQVFWFARAGKVLAFLGTWTIIFDIAGEDHVKAFSRRIASMFGRLSQIRFADTLQVYLLWLVVALYFLDDLIIGPLVFHSRYGYYPGIVEFLKYRYRDNFFNLSLLLKENLYGVPVILAVVLAGILLGWIAGLLEKALDGLAGVAKAFFASEKLRARASFIALLLTALGFSIDILTS